MAYTHTQRHVRMYTHLYTYTTYTQTATIVNHNFFLCSNIYLLKCLLLKGTGYKMKGLGKRAGTQTSKLSLSNKENQLGGMIRIRRRTRHVSQNQHQQDFTRPSGHPRSKCKMTVTGIRGRKNAWQLRKPVALHMRKTCL